MKNIYKQFAFSISLFLISFTGIAKIITVNNNVLSAGQYTNLQTAITAANVDDTVYVAPSPYNYGDIVINRRITLIGGGHDVSNTQFKYQSTVGNIRLDSIFNKTISGLKLQGLGLSGTLQNNSSYQYNNVTVERCALSMNVMGTGWIIKNNHVYNLVINNNTNVFITNNIFLGSGYTAIQISNNPSVLIANNLFLFPNTYYFYSPFSTVTYANVSNNIFFYASNVNVGCTLCTFTNNITFNDAQTVTAIPSAANTGGGNKNNVDPKFNNAPYHNSAYNSTEAANSDWKLQAGSPGKNAGSDGKDIGLYGGSYPPVNNTGIPGIPQMQTLNINTAVVPQGGTLNFTFTAKKQQ